MENKDVSVLTTEPDEFVQTIGMAISAFGFEGVESISGRGIEKIRKLVGVYTLEAMNQKNNISVKLWDALDAESEYNQQQDPDSSFSP